MIKFTKKLALSLSLVTLSAGHFAALASDDNLPLMDLNSQPTESQTVADDGTVMLTQPEFNTKSVQLYQQGAYENAALPRDLLRLVAKHAAFQRCLENESLLDLAVVCKDWGSLITRELKVGESLWKIWHGINTPEREKIFQRFLNGVLVYKPNQAEGDFTNGISFPIRRLLNPLGGTFDLSQCGDAGQYLSIATGFRKKKLEENKGKVEIWLAPRFLIEKKLGSSAAHFQPIMDGWSEELAELGMFFNDGAWAPMDWYDYLADQDLVALSRVNVLENWRKSRLGQLLWVWGGMADPAPFSCFVFKLA